MMGEELNEISKAVESRDYQRAFELERDLRLKAEASLYDASLCSVCAGTGKLASKLRCICDGTGASAQEMLGLRQELYRVSAERDKLLAACCYYHDSLEVIRDSLSQLGEKVRSIEELGVRVAAV